MVAGQHKQSNALTLMSTRPTAQQRRTSLRVFGTIKDIGSRVIGGKLKVPARVD